MIRSLILMRHAKSDWSVEGAPDHDRTLAPRGRRAAAAMGRALAASVPTPELVICSTALRARATLAGVLATALARPEDGTEPGPDVWALAPAIEYDRSIYLCGAAGILGRIAEVPPAVARLMVVGHNPDLEQAAAQLARSGPAADLARLAQGFPTGAAALFTAETGWAALAETGARLEAFLLPRALDA